MMSGLPICYVFKSCLRYCIPTFAPQNQSNVGNDIACREHMDTQRTVDPPSICQQIEGSDQHQLGALQETWLAGKSPRPPMARGYLRGSGGFRFVMGLPPVIHIYRWGFSIINHPAMGLSPLPTFKGDDFFPWVSTHWFPQLSLAGLRSSRR